MKSSVEFILTMLAMLLIAMIISLRAINWPDYFSTRTGKGILKGIVLAVLFAIGLALLSGCSGTYMNNASVYAGLDYTKKLSPQCEDTGPDNHTTSNLGLRANLYQSDDDRFRTNAKYTHHSCAFSPDDKSYDALGFELEYMLWNR